MHKSTSFLLLLICAATPAWAQRDLGSVDIVTVSKTIPVRVSADEPQLNSLALEAFESHGRYRVLATGYTYDIRFSVAGPSEVRLDITKRDGEPVADELVPGTSARNALLRAADIAVEKTNGLGLRGYFASRIAFIGRATGSPEVYESDLFFGDVRRITNDHADALMPRWSPDGTKIIYTSYRHGAPDIYLIDLATNQLRTFASYKGTNISARYSPDGRRVAMVLTGTGSPEIWVSDASGHSPFRLTHTDTVKSSPCWSPDGGRLVFAQQPGPQLYIISAAGGGMQRIADGFSTYCSEPDWSRADPDKIAFTFMRGGRFQIGVYSFSTGTAAQASKASFDGVEPSWLPDGRHLVYTARNSVTTRICILDTDTQRSTPISPPSFGSALQASVLAR